MKRLICVLTLIFAGCKNMVPLPLSESLSSAPKTPNGGPVSGSAHHGMPIFVMVGHSNMSGRGAEPSSFGSDARIVMMGADHRWRTAAEPTDIVDASAGVSPGIAFAHAYMAAHSVTSVGLINCAAGGSTTSQWGPSYPLFINCQSAIRAAQADGYIAGVLACTGENDCDGVHRTEWNDSFMIMVNALRKLVLTPYLPVVYVIVSSTYPTDDAVCQLRATELGFSAPNIQSVDADGMPTEDGYHITTAAQEIIGQRMAAKL